jgi:glycosyltransferase involved in cell wall biosynthesis
VRSILAGDFHDFELLVVDQDEARTLGPALLAAFPGEARLRHFWIDLRALDRARNVGLEHARGDILVFVDDDVEVDRGWLRAYVEAFAASPTPGAVAGRLDPRWLVARPAWLPEEREYLLGLYNSLPEGALSVLPGEQLPIGANFAVLRSVADEVGGFDEALDYSYARRASMISGGDSLFCLRIKRAGHILVYQPAARCWHKISGRKLTRRWFVRRMFWDGYTSVSVLFRAGSATRSDAARYRRVHLRSIVRRIWRVCFDPKRGGAEAPAGRRLMYTLGECANSLGVVRASWKLRMTGTLP